MTATNFWNFTFTRNDPGVLIYPPEIVDILIASQVTESCFQTCETEIYYCVKHTIVNISRIQG